MFGAPSAGSAPSLGNPSYQSVSVFPCVDNGSNKRKRRPAGTPDPDAEVVSLSPKTLLESDRYVCEICNQGFQRDQNLQMHRRRHKVPWKLLKRETPEVKKRVFVCPEPTCLHHDPCHALGDLVGIKKHFRRKHSNHKQWTCEKCSKGYAVQSDYKAHLKTCGTRGHSCDCGRVFSRVESFIEHQDACNAGRERQELQVPQSACLSRTASSPSPSCDTNFSAAAAWPVMKFPGQSNGVASTMDPPQHNLELQLLPATHSQSPNRTASNQKTDENHSTRLQLSIGPANQDDAPPNQPNKKTEISWLNNASKALDNLNGKQNSDVADPAPVDPFRIDTVSASKLKEHAREQLKLATAEKAYAEEARQQAKLQIELAEKEFANAKRIRQQAQAELDKAQMMREQAIKQVNNTILQITCQSCKKHFQAAAQPSDENSLAVSYMSSVVTEGQGENDNKNSTKIISL
ncbi:zinc finger protein SHOOT GRAVITROPISM 5-like isoform X1 [Nymphaea colorata]|nr:zinc finger protein SHOOT GRAVITROPISM 5-like isoform X1 [Nymphaea colorata]